MENTLAGFVRPSDLFNDIDMSRFVDILTSPVRFADTLSKRVR